MSFLYETHLHTRQGSICSNSKGREYIQRYQDAGYTGIFITDHFFNGNTPIPQNLPWREWVKRFCRGYEDAREEGERRGLDVFFGWEETFDGDDYLVYGLSKDWLLEHPQAAAWTREAQYQEVRRAGGCVVHAHPFRQHYYIRRVSLFPALIDGVEAANAGNHEASYDALGMRYAQALGLPATAGSDLHDAGQFSADRAFGVYLKERLGSAADYAAAILQRRIAGLRFSPGRCDFHGNETIQLPVDLYHAQGRRGTINALLNL